NGHRSNCNVSSVFLEGRVKAHRNNTFTCLHYENRGTKRKTWKHNFRLYADIFPADFQCCFLSAEEMYDPDTGKCLRNNCRKGSSPDIHIKSENKDRIQDNIGNCTDQYR